VRLIHAEQLPLQVIKPHSAFCDCNHSYAQAVLASLKLPHVLFLYWNSVRV